MTVVTLSDFRPSSRVDDVPFTEARVEESTASTGPWTELETFTLDPVDADPSQPASRDFTVTNATSELMWFRVVFIDGDGNTQTSDAIGPTGYPSAEELVAASSVDALTSLTDEEQQALRDASIAAIEEFCNQSFELELDATKYVDGPGTGVLYLPKRLVNLTAIDVPDSALALSDVALSATNDIISIRPDSIIGNYYTNVLRELNDHLPLNFVWGRQNITITGDWGWSSVPDAVKIAIRRDMEDTALADSQGLSETIRAYRKMGVRDISQGNLRATMSGALGLSPTTMLLLEPYVWMGPIGAVT